jgi:hypothetical protein
LDYWELGYKIMPINLDDAFGPYTREELQAALRSIDPKKNPEDYAAVKAELERSLPAFVGESCLDVAALRKLDAVVQPSTDSKAVIVVAALGATGYLVWRLLNHSYETPEIYWEHAAVVMVVVAVLWVSALWKTTVNSYRFAGGTISCVRLGEVAWEQSLSDLVWVEEKSSRNDSWLVFHWPTSTRRIELQLSDFEKYGFVAS